MIDQDQFEVACLKIRERNPLIHCITNYVAMEFNADALLAAGASPLMSYCREEMEDIALISDALVVNIGCLDGAQIEGMKAAAGMMNRLGKPWLLDPVGAGASHLRTDVSHMLTDLYHPSVIRGNASEIMALMGLQAKSRGVDSGNDAEEAREAAVLLARQSGAVVSVSGEADIITDGSRIERIEGGNAIMCKVTAMGCTASALTAAFLPVCGSAFEAAAFGMMLMARAGEKAAAVSKGNASMRINFIDALYNNCRK